MATHSSIFAWEIPWTEEPGRLYSIGVTRPNVTEQLTISHTFTEILAPSARRGHSEEMQQNPKEGLR